MGKYASYTASPSVWASIGEGIAWQRPPWATGAGIGASQDSSVTIINIGITGNVVTFVTTQQSEPLAAGQTVTITDVANNTFLNNQTLTVLSTGLSATGFQANFPHADVPSGGDAGVVTPTTRFAYAPSFDGAVAPPSGQYVTYVSPDGTGGYWSGSGQTQSGYYASTYFAPYYYGVGGRGGAFSGSGVNGGPLANTLVETSPGALVPTLPQGAVVQAIYAIAKGTASDPAAEAGYGLTVSNGTTTYTLLSKPSFNTGWQVTTNLGTDLATVLGGFTFSFSLGATLEVAIGGANPYWAYGVCGFAIIYSVGSGSIPAAQLQTLQGTNSGFAVPGNGVISGVIVNLNTGMEGNAGTCTLEVQLTVNSVPVGNPKPITVGNWSTPYSLGSTSDDWGATLTTSMVNGSSGIGVNISGTLSSGAQVNLNTLSLSIEVFVTAPTVWVSIGNTKRRT